MRVYVALHRAHAGRVHVDLFGNKTRDFLEEEKRGEKHDLQGNDKQPKSSDTRTAERHQSRHHRMTSLRHTGIHLPLKDDEVKPAETEEWTSVTGTAIVGQ